jgi:hypothetical protein
VEKREESAPVEKRSLVIARLRAPKRTQHGCYLQPVSDDGFQRSLLSIIKPLLQMSINNSAIRTFIQRLLEPHSHRRGNIRYPSCYQNPEVRARFGAANRVVFLETGTDAFEEDTAPAGFLRWEGPIVLPNDPLIRVDLLSGTKSGPAEPAGG